MVHQMLEKWLHLYTKHTNRMIPYNQYIDIDKYPEQAEDVGSKISLKYRNNNIVDKREYENGTDQFDPHYVFEKDFIILRHDLTSPHRFIAISEDYSVLLVDTIFDTVKDTEIEKSTNILTDGFVARYPLQINNAIGIEIMNHYVEKDNTITGIILRCDATEPSYAIIAEFIGGKVRFITGDEAMSEIPKETKMNHYKTKEEIIEIRRNALEGKEIWS